MAKDDYFRLVYQILSYLYKALKQGKSYIGIEEVKVIIEDIPLAYFDTIINDLSDEGYIRALTTSVRYVHTSSKEKVEAVKISMRGIEYLQENSTMRQIAKFLKEIKEITPLI